jgi:prepilin signal peptidase PulO-like enzyme (type II secretory pathway)
MATGDVALGTALAAWLGFCATPMFLLSSCIAYVAYAAPIRAKKGETWVPMGPALAAGFMFSAFTGFQFGF